MSIALVGWALEQRTGSTGAKAVLVALANHANRQGECYPAQAVLARQTEMDERSVRRHLVDLEHRGLLARRKRARKSGGRATDVYRLIVQADVLPAMQPDTMPGNLPDTMSANGGLPDVLPGNVEGYRTIHTGLPDIMPAPTSLEPSLNRTETDTAVAAASQPNPVRVPTRENGGDSGVECSHSEATAAMLQDADSAASRIDPKRRQAFLATARVIAGGEDATAWRDHKSGDQVPWADRLRLFRIAIAKLEAEERGEIRRCLQLTIQQQYDPLALRQSNDPPPDSEAGRFNGAEPDYGGKRLDASRSSAQLSPVAKVLQLRTEDQQQKATDEARRLRVEAWAAKHPLEAKEIRAEIQRKYQGNGFVLHREQTMEALFRIEADKRISEAS